MCKFYIYIIGWIPDLRGRFAFESDKVGLTFLSCMCVVHDNIHKQCLKKYSGSSFIFAFDKRVGTFNLNL